MRISWRVSSLGAIVLALSLAAGAAPAAPPRAPVALTDVCGTPGKDDPAPATVLGIVNVYYPATTSAAAGTNSLVVGPAAGAIATFPTLAAGDLLLVIQMQDAAIDSSNTVDYGDGPGGNSGSGATALNSAGKYEYVAVTAVSGGFSAAAGGTITISGANGVGFINSYSNADAAPSANPTAGQKRFQVVRVPQWTNVTLSNVTSVTASAWDGARGGVVAMDVSGTLTLNGGTINANGLGFRGGGAQAFGGTGSGLNTDFRNLSAAGCHGSKGEGIAGTPKYIFTGAIVTTSADEGYPQGTMARGAPGNAGGGGTDFSPSDNNDNSGGGGGGNGGAGGLGGNSETNQPTGGRGGAAFSASTSQVVMGGGGGAGSRNSGGPGGPTASSGAAGGGIIMVRAFDVSGSGTATANGTDAVDLPSHHGGGGGGAGGTIVFTTLSGSLSTLTCTANGGAGADAGVGGSQLGPGGGGGGGVILTTSAPNVASSSTAGANGLTAANIPLGSQPGSTGLVSGVSGTSFAVPTDIPGAHSGAEGNAFLVEDVNVLEGDAGTSTMTFTVTLGCPQAGTVTVDVQTADGTATIADSDYTAVPLTTLTFLAGEVSKTVNVTIIGDTVVEPNQTLFLNLTNATGGARIGDSQGQGTIWNDDSPPSFRIEADVTVTEPSSGSTTVSFNVKRDGAVGSAVSVDFTTVNGVGPTGAVAPGDYAAQSGTLNFAIGEIEKPVTITINSDTLDEFNETFTLVLSNPSAGTTITTGTRTATINDAVEDVLPDISIDSPTIGEPAAGTATLVFTVSLSAVSGRDVSVDFATSDVTALAAADYVATSGTLTIPAGSASGTISVTINSDALDEASETFHVDLTNPQFGVISVPTGTGTITDNPATLPPTLSIDDVTIGEPAAGTATLTFTVTLSAVSGQAVSVNFATSDGTATAGAGADYLSTSGTLIIPAGNPSGTIDVTVNADALDEFSETFTMTLSGGANYTVAGSDLTGIGTITDDAADVEPTISIDDVTIAEPAAGTATLTFTVTLSAPSGKPVSVDFATVDGTAVAVADFAGTTGTLNIPAGSPSGTINVTINSDALDEFDETFTVSLSGGANYAAAGNDLSGTGTITDDVNDVQPDITINSPTIVEPAAGATAFAFTVTLSAPSGKPVSVDFVTANGSAAAGSDYVAVNGTLTIPAGSPSGTINVTINSDALDESDETFTMTLSNPVNGNLTGSVGTMTIQDNPATGLAAFSISDPSVIEGDAGTVNLVFTVTLTPASGKTVMVDFATSDGTAVSPGDYSSNSGTLTFAPLETTKTVIVVVAGDTFDEVDETLTMTLSNAVDATISDATGIGTITDDDGTPGISIADVTVFEGNAGTTDAVFTVTLSSPSGQPVMADFATSNGSAIAGPPPGGDYQATSGTLTFNPGVTTLQITVLVNGDTTDEPGPPETFNVTLSNLVNAVPTDLTAIGNIRNDDTPADLWLTKTVDNATPNEGDTITYTISIFYTGPVDATDVLVVDVIPGGLTWDVGTVPPSQGTYNSQTGEWQVGTLAAPINPQNPTTATLTISAIVNAGTRGQTIVNKVVIGSGVQDDQNTLNNQAEVPITVVVRDLTIEMAGCPAGVPGPDPVDCALPAGTVGAFYSQQPTTLGGLPSYIWSVAQMDATGFPFNLDVQTGLISGFAKPGTYGFTLRVTDAQNPADSDVRRFTVIVSPAGTSALNINATPVPPDGMVGVSYSHTFTATGGTPAYAWSIVGGALPPGLALNPSTGVVSGTPTTVVGSPFSFTLQVTDSLSATDTQGFSIDINPNPVQITTTQLPTGSVGSPYNQLIDATGGVGPTFTWTILPGGTLPPGTTLSGTSRTVSLAGTPVANGTYVFTLQISDDGQSNVTDVQAFIVLISAAGTQPLITTSSVPVGTVNDPYLNPDGSTVQLSASGGTLPYAWSVPGATFDPGTNTWSGGPIPPGLVLNAATGTLTGTPTQAGVYQVLLRVEDSDSPAGVDTQEITIVISTPVDIITATPLNSGQTGQLYSVQLEAVGGVPPYQWSITSGSLPAGLSLSASSGVIDGTITAGAGTATFEATATDENGASDSKTFTLLVVDLAPGFVTILTTQLPRGVRGVPYQATLEAASGNAPDSFTWSIQGGTFDAGTQTWSGGNLPAGLRLSTDGFIFGTPTTANLAPPTVVFGVAAAVAAASATSVPIAVIIEDPLVITTARLKQGGPGATYDDQIDFAGGSPLHFFQIVQGSLPPGLSLNSGPGGAGLGQITGTPVKLGTYTFKVQLTDGDGHTVQKVFTIVIASLENVINAGYCGGGVAAAPPSGRTGPAALALAALVLLGLFLRRRLAAH